MKNFTNIDKTFQPVGHSIEVRVYAEDCLNQLRPSSGKADDVYFSEKARVETWIKERGGGKNSFFVCDFLFVHRSKKICCCCFVVQII